VARLYTTVTDESLEIEPARRPLLREAGMALCCEPCWIGANMLFGRLLVSGADEDQ
jgi:hypothetical protein